LTIRGVVLEALANQGMEWMMRSACVGLQEEYVLSYDAIEDVLNDELP
jgi:hypothetical protein